MAITPVISPSSLNNCQLERENVGQGQDVIKSTQRGSFHFAPVLRLSFIHLCSSLAAY